MRDASHPRAARAARHLALSLAVVLTLLVPTAGDAASLETWIVGFEEPPTSSQLETLAGVARGVHGFTHLPAAAVTVTPEDLPVLAGLPDVRDVHPNRSLQPLTQQSTRTIRADAAWDLGFTGRDVGIAVIDTGIDGTHPDLCAEVEFCHDTPVKTVQNVKILGRQSLSPEPVVVLEDQVSTDTSSGHGTHVAGIAAGLGVASVEEGRYRGVAPDARLIGLGTGEAIEAVNVLAAFDWVIEHADDPAYRIQVINNSWGPGAGEPFDPDYPVQRAIDAAHAAGLTVVFGAGNDGPATDTLNAFSVNPNAISVAGGTKDGHIAFFSSRGVPGSERWRPTVTAPGYHIAAPRASTGFLSHLADLLAPNPDPIAEEDLPSYASGSGTSMAAPHVAGVVAVLQEAALETRGVPLEPDEVRAVLEATAVSDDPDRGPGGMPNYQPYAMGAGYVDAVAAVEAVTSGSLPATDSPATQVRAFHGRIGPAALVPTTTFDTTFEVDGGARSLNVMADWDLLANDVDLELYTPAGELWMSTLLHCDPDGEPNGYSSFCSSQPNERITVVDPDPGLWRAVVRGGTLSTIEDVTGLWSAAYPADHELPPPPEPAAIELTATPTSAPTGVEVTVAATVRDADGNPVPGATLSWSSSGVGSVLAGESESRADGGATGRLGSRAPGTQQITVGAGDASATIEVTWLGLVLPDLGSTPGWAAGGGWIGTGADRHAFGFHVEHRENWPAPAGELSYRGPDGPRVRAEGVDRLVIDGASARIQGPAILDGVDGYRFRLEVGDHATPGRDGDTFDLVVTDALGLVVHHEATGDLGGGNIEIGD